MRELLKKYQLHIIAALVLIVAGIVIYVAVQQSSLSTSNSNTPSEATGTEPTTPPAAPPVLEPAASLVPTPLPMSTTLKITGKPLPGKSYQEVVETYKDRRVQFDDTCKATPNFATFKNGPEIMFDNRSAVEKVIKLDKAGYKIGPYGFVILSITSQTVPHAISVDCNQLFNTAIINLQK